MTKIYVGGLPYQTDEGQLSQIFAEYGEVSSSKIINDRETGRSKGFGFVEMPNTAEAKKAIAELHEAELEGRSLTVNEARPQAPRSNGGFSGGNGGGYRGGNGGGGGFRGGRY
jgi:RNA recognition motif-containing protein